MDGERAALGLFIVGSHAVQPSPIREACVGATRLLGITPPSFATVHGSRVYHSQLSTVLLRPPCIPQPGMPLIVMNATGFQRQAGAPHSEVGVQTSSSETGGERIGWLWRAKPIQGCRWCARLHAEAHTRCLCVSTTLERDHATSSPRCTGACSPVSVRVAGLVRLPGPRSRHRLRRFRGSRAARALARRGAAGRDSSF